MQQGLNHRAQQSLLLFGREAGEGKTADNSRANHVACEQMILPAGNASTMNSYGDTYTTLQNGLASGLVFESRPKHVGGRENYQPTTPADNH
jgi:hypothetical protein